MNLNLIISPQRMLQFSTQMIKYECIVKVLKKKNFGTGKVCTRCMISYCYSVLLKINEILDDLQKYHLRLLDLKISFFAKSLQQNTQLWFPLCVKYSFMLYHHCFRIVIELHLCFWIFLKTFYSVKYKILFCYYTKFFQFFLLWVRKVMFAD